MEIEQVHLPPVPAEDVRTINRPEPTGSGYPNYTGTGSPEGEVTAVVGKTYLDTATGVIYQKLSGTGNTGWGFMAEGYEGGISLRCGGNEGISLFTNGNAGINIATTSGFDEFSDTNGGLTFAAGSQENPNDGTLGPIVTFQMCGDNDGLGSDNASISTKSWDPYLDGSITAVETDLVVSAGVGAIISSYEDVGEVAAIVGAVTSDGNAFGNSFLAYAGSFTTAMSDGRPYDYNAALQLDSAGVSISSGMGYPEGPITGFINLKCAALGFFDKTPGDTSPDAAPQPQQTVTGSRSDGTALTSLLTALAAYGLIIDDSTA